MRVIPGLAVGRSTRLIGMVAVGALVAALSPLRAEPTAADSGTVLVEMIGAPVTQKELDRAMAKAPFAARFDAMSRDEQAARRGEMLKQLEIRHLLRLEARSLGLANTASFNRDVLLLRKRALHRRYMEELRDSVVVPAEKLDRLRDEFRDEPDAYKAARTTAVLRRYQATRILAVQQMQQDLHVVTFEGRIRPGIGNDTVLAAGDNGLSITYGDLVDGEGFDTPPQDDWVRDRLYERLELEVVARAAGKFAVAVQPEVERYAEDRLADTLRAELERRWTGSDDDLRGYYRRHPEIGGEPTRWHVAQVVSSSRDVAARLHKAISAGADLSKIAGAYSIEPHSRQHGGDMGWIREGSVHPAIESVLARLQPGEIGDIVETPAGFHIVSVLERHDGARRDFSALKPELREALRNEKMAEYLAGLRRKYRVEWKVLDQQAQVAGKPRG